jgi:hypothetical protein
MITATVSLGQSSVLSLSNVNPTSAFQEESGNFDTDIIGQWHNNAIQYALEQLIQSNTSPTDENFKTMYISYLEEFYESKGLGIDLGLSGEFTDFLADSSDNMCVGQEDISESAQLLLCDIQANLDNFINESISLEEFLAIAENLRKDADELEDEVEQKIVGITAATTKHSVQFWTDNFDNYYDVLRGMIESPRPSAFKMPVREEYSVHGPNAGTSFARDLLFSTSGVFKIRWWAVGASDAMGAWRWGKVGAVVAGGVPGAVACGLAGAAGHSLGSLIGQAIIGLF